MKIHLGNALLLITVVTLTTLNWIDRGWETGIIGLVLCIICGWFFAPTEKKKTINVALMSDEKMNKWVRDNIGDLD